MMDSNLERRCTARLILRRPDASDRDFVVDLFSRVELVAYRPNPVPDSPLASEQRLARDIEHWRLHGFGRWAVEHGGRLIGFGGLTNMRGFAGLAISYHLHPAS
jgi:RimJ/RimL family protein N-acetyltransferase